MKDLRDWDARDWFLWRIQAEKENEFIAKLLMTEKEWAAVKKVMKKKALKAN